MSQLRKFAYITLIVLNVFLALTAFLGGIGLVANLNAPPVEMLQGSIFKSYAIPGLALFVLVGGGASISSWLLIRRNKFAVFSAIVVGVMIKIFEFVEVMVIGSPAGIALTLQIFYYGLGLLIVMAAMGVWFIDLLSIKETA